MKKNIIIFVLLFLTGMPFLFAQKKVIDKVVAVIGTNMIMLSDIENQYAQYILQGYKETDSSFKCVLLEEVMFQKLLLNQAHVDSVAVTDTQIEQVLENKISFFEKQMGGEEQFVKYLGKSISEFKNDMHDNVKDLLLQQNIEGKITENVKITPSEVKVFFNNLNKDSIPLIASVVEVGQIVKIPKINEDEKNKTKEKLNQIRGRVLNGEDFSTLAILYSEDEATSSKGGEIGLTSRGELDADVEGAAFKLKVGEVSSVIAAKDGYHLIKLVERRGEMINIKDILIKNKVANEDMLKAKLFLDSIYTLLKKDTITFENAAKRYSDDPSKINGGLLINSETGTSKFEPTQLDQSVFFVVDKLKINSFSQPVPMTTEDGKKAYRILYLKARSDPHRANMKNDYDFIQEAALKQKKNKIIEEWVKKKAAITYIHVNDEYKDCKFNYHWFK